MKTIVAFLISWLFFVLGDLASRLLNFGADTEWWTDIWLPAYSGCMLFSADIQDWAEGEGPWFPWTKCNDS